MRIYFLHIGILTGGTSSGLMNQLGFFPDKALWAPMKGDFHAPKVKYAPFNIYKLHVDQDIHLHPIM